MDLSAVKMVVTDMDGTLLNSNHEVSDYFYELFEKLYNAGITFVAASGRQYGSMVKKLDPISDHMIFVAENGALVKSQGQEMLVTPLEDHRLKEILDLLGNKEEIHPVLCCRDQAYATTSDDKFLNKLSEYYTEYSRLDGLDSFDDLVLKIAVYHFEDSEGEIFPLVEHLQDEMKVKVSGQHWVDLSHINAHKGYAINKLQARLGIKPEETLVFGDYKNDLEMLQEAKFSFSMANAHPEVTQIARYTTDSNDDYGVEKILEKLLKSKS